MSTVIKAKMNKIADKMEDPRETLDYSYEKQLELLQNVKRGVAEVTTSKKRLELQKAKLQQSIDKLDQQARDAVKANREDLARLALEGKAALVAQVQGLDQQIADLNQEQQSRTAEKRLSTKWRSSEQKRRPSKHNILLQKLRSRSMNHFSDQ
jgi:phage shock protein A